MSSKNAKRERREQRAAGIETKHERRRRELREAYEAEQRRSEMEKARLSLLTPQQRRAEDAQRARDIRTTLTNVLAILR
jgi:hypothetical protein